MLYDIGIRVALRLTLEKIESGSRFQIVNRAIYIHFGTYTIGKDMNLLPFSPAMVKS